MTFQVKITPIAEAQIEQAYRWYRERNPEFADRWFRERNPEFADRWFRGLMNTIATLQQKPQRCTLAVEHEIFPEEVRQHLYGKAKNVYRVLFAIRDDTVSVLYIRHSSQAPLTLHDVEELEGSI